MNFLKRLKNKSLLILIFVLTLVSPGLRNIAVAESEGALEVLLIRPNTENVMDVQQISVTFNKAMVPLGDF